MEHDSAQRELRIDGSLHRRQFAASSQTTFIILTEFYPKLINTMTIIVTPIISTHHLFDCLEHFEVDAFLSFVFSNLLQHIYLVVTFIRF